MLINLSEYTKSNLFWELKIDKKFAVISDSEIKNVKNFYKIESLEPVGQILALKEKYEFVFVILDRLNWDNIFRLYKYNLDWVCVLNLNAWYTWIWTKVILPDLDDIYIKPHIKVLEPMDKENYLFFIDEFLSSKWFYHIRVPNKDIEEKIWADQVDMDYREIINFNQFWISWFNWTILSYWSMLQESINVAGLLQAEWLGIDMFWIWNYKKDFNNELISSLENQDKVFVIWDFSDLDFKDFIYSKFYDAGIVKEDIYFITPQNINKQVVKEFLGESTEMDPVKIYERIRKHIGN
jgi:hypothetical protein